MFKPLKNAFISEFKLFIKWLKKSKISSLKIVFIPFLIALFLNIMIVYVDNIVAKNVAIEYSNFSFYLTFWVIFLMLFYFYIRKITNGFTVND